MPLACEHDAHHSHMERCLTRRVPRRPRDVLRRPRNVPRRSREVRRRPRDVLRRRDDVVVRNAPKAIKCHQKNVLLTMNNVFQYAFYTCMLSDINT